MSAERACDCSGHRAVEFLLTGVGKHRYRLDTDEGPGWYTRWRWTCDCGARGRWQNQSPQVAFHAWEKHAGLNQAAS